MGQVDLSKVLLNLKMDRSAVDTEEARAYLKNKEFRSDSSIQALSSDKVIDCFGSKIFCLPYDSVHDVYISILPPLPDDQLQVRSNGLKKLASEIEKQTNLICQLEFLIRNNPVRDTKVSIHLIVQHLLYLSENEVLSREETIFMENKTPLMALGCALQSLKLSNHVYIYAVKETAVICYLFTEMCRKAGLDCVKLVIGESATILSRELSVPTFSRLFEDSVPEVIGIITEKSDMESAVEAFLNSEAQPFPLTRIYVQESIYKEFKDAVTWKCRSQQYSNLSLKSNSMDAFRYETKTIYLDYAGTVDEINHKDQLIFVEAYRTSNELLSLINKNRKQLCLSLWASGISEANEIALKLNVPIVWINDYYNFDGPSAVSQAVYDKTYQYQSYCCYEPGLTKFTQWQKAWAMLSFNERYEKVAKAFDSADKKLGDAIKEKSMTYWKWNEFISVQNKTMIVGITSAKPIIGFTWGSESNVEQVWVSIAKALINGSAFAYSVSVPSQDERILGIFEKLAKCGIPVADLDATDSPDSTPQVTYWSYPEGAQTKVIWTSFGTAFAN